MRGEERLTRAAAKCPWSRHLRTHDAPAVHRGGSVTTGASSVRRGSSQPRAADPAPCSASRRTVSSWTWVATEEKASEWHARGGRRRRARRRELHSYVGLIAPQRSQRSATVMASVDEVVTSVCNHPRARSFPSDDSVRSARIRGSAPVAAPAAGRGPVSVAPIRLRVVTTASAESSYTSRHLSVLEGLEAVRKRPGMYIGSTDSRGLMHCLWRSSTTPSTRRSPALHADRHHPPR